MSTVVAQDIFQSKLDAIFIGMEGVTGIADDMVIAGRNEMEHDMTTNGYSGCTRHFPIQAGFFIGMEGVTGIAWVIAGRNEMEHDRNFLAFMEKCMENNLTLNSEKI